MADDGALDSPRASVFGPRSLCHLAHELAQVSSVVPGRIRYAIPREVAQLRSRLERAYARIAEAQAAERAITPAAQWLLDNFHVVGENLGALPGLLPREPIAALPLITTPASTGPDGGTGIGIRIRDLLRHFAAHVDNRFQPEVLTGFLQAYQAIRPLTMGELWAVPSFFRLTILETLADIAEGTVRALDGRLAADALADAVLGEHASSAGDPGTGVRLPESGLNLPFVVQLVERLRYRSEDALEIVDRISQRVASEGLTIDECVRREHHRQSANNASVAHIIGSLREIDAVDWRDIFSELSVVERLLEGVASYAQVDQATRERYRHVIADLAARSGRPESDIAARARDAARAWPDQKAREADIGWHLVDEGRPQLEEAIGYRPSPAVWLRRAVKRNPLPTYLCPIALLTALILGWAVTQGMVDPGTGELALMIVLGAFPASDLAVRLVNLAASRLVPARPRPRLDLHKGAPAEAKTLVVMPVMLTTRTAIDEHCERLEVHYLSNPDPAFRFALLSDWVDSDSESTGEDGELLAHAQEAIARLNDRYPAGFADPRFHLFHRRRTWSVGEDCWMGWERKRGKLLELNNLLLHGRPGNFIVPAPGDPVVPRDVRFVLTLDGDTRLPIGAVRRLLETALHPLNTPRRDSPGQVTAGYGVLQPRVTPLLPDEAGQSLFQWAATGASGMDPYAGAVSDVYQDLFGEGIFTGKGLYHLETFSQAIADRVPENAVLSHDLLEGQLARCCLVSDVEVYEEFPSHSEVAAARSHRWMRGDWQLLPWLAGLHGTRSGLARWQIFDNLRRSLSAPAAVATLLAAWCLPHAIDAVWITLVVAPLVLPGFLMILLDLLGPLPGIPLASRVRSTFADLLAETGRAVVALALLGQNAWLTVDAVARAITRLVTRRRLLEWITAADMKSRTGYSLPMFTWPLKSASVLVIASTALILWLNPAALPAAAPWLAALWLAPLFARLASVPRAGFTARPGPPGKEETRALRDAGRHTWRFFATFVTAEDRHLPPDNFQEDPTPVVARRTSPTNIGLYLLSVLTARDCGWLGLIHMKERLAATLATLDTLETCHGHFLNWYDTMTGAALTPRYVSTVDSGNLAGHLLALKQGCAGIAAGPVLERHYLAGLRDTLRLFEESLAAGAEARRSTVATSRELHARARDIHGALDDMLEGDDPGPPGMLAWLRSWERPVLELADLAAALGAERGEEGAEYASWAHLLATDFTSHLHDYATLLPAGLDASNTASPDAACELWCRLARDFGLFADFRRYPERCNRIARALEAAGADAAAAALASQTLECSARAAHLLAELDAIAANAHRLSARMDFGFLYDRHRGLFSIGYRPENTALDPSYYDLLASEARLASLIAVARGQVPPRHWFRLGRPLTGSVGAPLLLSWSGSMFEYLMPDLVMHSPEGSLLRSSCARAIDTQKAWGRRHGLPWGVSESAFNVRDQALTYQYSAFGVPALGLKRGLSRDLVVAPYATLLAAMFDPRDAVRNLSELRRLGALGRYGYHDAVDFTPGRVPEGLTGAVVRNYMAHHQGMILVALGNALGDGRMQHRFHAEPLVQAAELLLQERIPHRFRLASRPEELPAPVRIVQPGPAAGRQVALPVTAFPVAHLLSNRRYAVMITAAGSGYSVCDHRAVTRWREDAVQERHGTFIYIRDCSSGELWSATFEPVCAMPDSYDACFDEDRARITRHDGAIVTALEVVVSPEENAELRRVTITNTGNDPRVLDLTSYCEIVLAEPAADIAHPAFSNLFVETEFVPDVGALLASRRPRLATDPEVWAAHVLCPSAGSAGVEWETDRLRFLGRHGDVQAPLSVVDGRPLSGRTGRVLDPVFSLRTRITVPAGEKVCVAFATLVAASRDEALTAADKLNDPGTFERVSMLAWTYARAGLHFLRINESEARLFQTLSTHLLFANPALRAPSRLLADNRLPVTGLWRLGISGDRPIVVVRCLDDEHQAMAEQLLRAQAYWSSKLLAIDIVLLNERPQSYLQELQHRLEDLARQADALRSVLPGARAAVFVLRGDQITNDELTLLLAAARVVLLPREGTLAEQLARKVPVKAAVGPPRPVRPDAGSDVALAVPAMEFDNGIGGFAAGGREYAMVIGGDRHTPAPWVNVIANPDFGCLVSESGSSCSWAANSRENQLTPWSNDPVTDPSGEQIHVRDDETRAVWTPVPRGPQRQHARHVVRHGQGWSHFQTAVSGVETGLLVFVAPDDPVKVSRLVLTNHTRRVRHLSVASFVEWVLGPNRITGAQHIVTSLHASGAILARNPWNADFGDRIAFLDLGGRQTSHTCSRAEFFGRHGNAGTPGALVRQQEFSNRVGAGLDPCAALLTSLELGPGESATVVSVLGQAPDENAAGELIARYRTADLDAMLAEVERGWDQILGAVQLRTPDRGLDILMNRWLVYQVLSCRFWGRAGFYQAGGAYGFRDQLQDSLALMAPAPGLVREHLLRSATRQFEAGDVQHWWHPPSGRGVRTRCVDDRLWLPFVLVRYLAVTGDDDILDVQVPFLADRPLAPGEDDAHFQPDITERIASVYEHCALAIDASLGAGPHGLPLMGSGDWNDGMNRVGHHGTGESVWMAWFICSIVPSFSELAAARGDGARAERWKAAADAFAAAVEAQAWDGAWYRRGYFDDGTPLGSSTRPECRIDSIAQSWAVLSGASDPERARKAMDAVGEHLVRADLNLILLFTPPFDRSSPDPGYIRGYVPGLRENGGQYTHAAIWYLMAEARLGRAGNVGEALTMLNPAHQSSTRRKAFVHRTEPYVLAADIASEPPNAQRGGWTWYTGSAAWFHQAVIEDVLGMKFRAQTLELSPVLPPEWPRAELRYQARGLDYVVIVERKGAGSRVLSVEVDGEAVDGPSVQLARDGRTHRVVACIGGDD